MFPIIFALGIGDLGPNTKEGAYLIVMFIIGGAIFTPLMGIAFQATRSTAVSMSIPLAWYVVVAGYAFWGSRVVPLRNSSASLPDEVHCE